MPCSAPSSPAAHSATRSGSGIPLVVLLERIGDEPPPDEAAGVALLLEDLQGAEDEVVHVRVGRVEGVGPPRSKPVPSNSTVRQSPPDVRAGLQHETEVPQGEPGGDPRRPGPEYRDGHVLHDAWLVHV